MKYLEFLNIKLFAKKVRILTAYFSSFAVLKKKKWKTSGMIPYISKKENTPLLLFQFRKTSRRIILLTPRGGLDPDAWGFDRMRTPRSFVIINILFIFITFLRRKKVQFYSDRILLTPVNTILKATIFFLI